MIDLLTSPAWRWVLVSALIVAVLIARSRGRGVLAMMSLVFMVLAFGPVLVYLRGDEIYEGIVTDHVQVATQGFALALAGLLIADLIYPQRRPLASFAVPGRPGRYLLAVGAAQILLSAYALVVGAQVYLQAAGAPKGVRLEAAGSYHYVFLTCSTTILACWPLIRSTAAGRRLFTLHLATYVGYCALTLERDFVFVLLGLSVLGATTQVRQWLPRAVAAAGVGIVAVEVLGSGRSNDPDETAALLQGSLLFVDTRVHEYVPSGMDFQQGATYLDGAASALTQGLLGGDRRLTEWLVEQYAPGNDSGYGFSMTAEAYLNFGQVGILPVFLLAGLAVNGLLNRLDKSALAAHLGYFVTMFLPYMLRSDSRGLFAGLVTCLLVHGLISFLSDPTEGRVRR